MALRSRANSGAGIMVNALRIFSHMPVIFAFQKDLSPFTEIASYRIYIK
jgi:hypothetical protein